MSSSLLAHPGDLSAVLCPALAGPAEGRPTAAGPGPAAGLDGDAGEEAQGGEGGAAERPPPPHDEPAEEGGLRPAVPSSGGYAEEREEVSLCLWSRGPMLMSEMFCFRVEARGGAADQLEPERSGEEGGALLAAGAGDAAHRRHRAASRRRPERQLQQVYPELPGQGQRSLLLFRPPALSLLCDQIITFK